MTVWEMAVLAVVLFAFGATLGWILGWAAGHESGFDDGRHWYEDTDPVAAAHRARLRRDIEIDKGDAP